MDILIQLERARTWELDEQIWRKSQQIAELERSIQWYPPQNDETHAHLVPNREYREWLQKQLDWLRQERSELLLVKNRRPASL